MLKNKQVAGGVVIAGFLALFALMGPTSAGSLFANTASAGYGGGSSSSKVTICHNGNTIKVAKSAVSAHLAHGDVQGTCTTVAPTVLGASTSDKQEQIKSLNVQLLSLLQQLLALLRTQQ